MTTTSAPYVCDWCKSGQKHPGQDSAWPSLAATPPGVKVKVCSKCGGKVYIYPLSAFGL